jgi:hypothetical protein
MPTKDHDVRAAVRHAIKLAEVPGRIVNAYETAGAILRTLPNLDLSLEEIVDMMIEMPGSISAFEFSPPAAVIEIIIAADPQAESRISAAEAATDTGEAELVRVLHGASAS